MLKVQLYLHLLPGVDGEGVDSDGGGHPSGHLLLGLDGDGADSGVGGHVLVPYLAWCQPSGLPVSLHCKKFGEKNLT